MDIGAAIELMRAGELMQRAGWNGKNMWIALRKIPTGGDSGGMTLPYVYMKTAQGETVPWVCNQADLLAEDWQVYVEVT